MNIARLIRTRHWVQWVFLGSLILFPFTGLFHFDMGNGYVYVAGWQVWFDDYYLMLGVVGTVFFAATAFFYPLGQSFCGWLCPQFAVSELLGGMIRRLLGRNVLAGFDPEREGGRSKRRSISLVAAWVLLGLAVALVSVVGTFTILHYFYPTSELLTKLTSLSQNKLFWSFAVILLWLFALDFGFFRHFWCKYMCAFGLYQYLFRGRDTLRIRFQEERADDCRSCTLCRDVCPMDLDPCQPEIYTRCINCGICIDACESYMGRFDKPRLLDFGFGNREGQLIRIESNASPVKNARVIWPLVGTALSAALLVMGLVNFSPLKLTLQQDRPDAASSGIRYGAEAVNKGTSSVTYTVRVEGLPAGQVNLGKDTITLAVGEHTRVPLRVSQEGLKTNTPYPFEVLFTDVDSGAVYREFATYFMPEF